MNCRMPGIAVVAVALAICTAAHAEVKVTVNRNDESAANEHYKFKDVPSPSQTDAANKAKITVLAGRRDGNGGEVDRLIDGKLPSQADQPGGNFFFAAGTEGGRLLLDLGAVTEVKEVNSYSWHVNTRGPQVYKVYGGDPGQAPDLGA